MKKLNRQNLIIYLLSFLLPVFLLTTIFAIIQIYPFGNRSILITDLWHQYIHFYHYLYNSMTGDTSLLYSWNTGLGGNFIGNLAYYASSPFLFILFFFKENYLVEAVTLLILLKIGFAGLAISYFIRRKFPSISPLETILFSMFYSLMAYNIVYYYNLMWLDGIIWLPLLVLATEKLIDDNQIALFIFFLSLIFISNFYISYMIGLFIFLYFVTGIIEKYDQLGKKAILNRSLKFVYGTIIAAGISAILTIPTFFQLLLTEKQPLKEFEFTLNPLHLVYKLFSGTYDFVITGQGTPNLYIGTFVLFLVPLFFLSKNIKRSEKIRWGTLLVFLILSLFIPILNIVWHGGDIPNSFPYRYSFIVSFILFVISLKAYQKHQIVDIKIWAILYFLVVSITLLSIFYLDSDFKINQSWNLLFISIFTLIMVLKKKNFKIFIHLLFIVYVVGELSFNSGMLFTHLNNELGGISREQYVDYDDYEKVVKRLNQEDKGLNYRIETDLNKTYNDSLQLGVSSLSSFSSMMDNGLSKTLKSLGIAVRKAKYHKSGSTLFTEALLAQKYFISSKELSYSGYELIETNNNLNIYKNQFALSLGFLTDNSITEVQPNRFANPFDLQNLIFNSISKTENVPLFRQVIPEKIEYENAKTLNNDNANSLKHLIRINKNKPMKVIYTINMEQEMELYTLITTSQSIESTLTANRKKGVEYPSNENNGILKLGSFPSKQVKVELKINENEVKMNKEWFYLADLTYFTHLKNGEEGTFSITSINENQLRAQVNVQNENQLLLFTIPWDEGWRVEMNGQSIKPLKVMGSFLGIPVDQGEAEILLTFIPKGFLFGRILSIISIIIFLFIFWYEIFRKNKVKGGVQ